MQLDVSNEALADTIRDTNGTTLNWRGFSNTIEDLHRNYGATKAKSNSRIIEKS